MLCSPYAHPRFAAVPIAVTLGEAEADVNICSTFVTPSHKQIALSVVQPKNEHWSI